jgi:DNA-binding MarR family transcriptional regulator
LPSINYVANNNIRFMPHELDPEPMTGRKLTPKQRETLRRTIRAARLYRQSVATAPAGTSSRDLEVLLVLAQEGEVTGTEIGRALARDRPSVTRALERLRRRRLVRMSRTEGRRRVHELTARGWDLVQEFISET